MASVQSNMLYVKEYFGEKIGLYFTFMGHFSKWLTVPAGMATGDKERQC